MADTIILTEADYQALDHLLASEFARAINPGDHLADLRGELNKATIVAPHEVPADIVTMDTTVMLHDRDTGETDTYTLVYPKDADIANAKLSVLAPIGTAILGQRVGDKLRWRVPEGWRRLKVEQILFQPERDAVLHQA